RGLMDTGCSEAGAFLERLARARFVLERERREAPRLCEELLARKGAARREAAERDPRFHTWGLAELLLAKSAAAAEAEPEESGRLAELGLALVQRVDRGLHDERVL